ncbi:MAG TPA: c-type cytochrome biogenesis protein CcmI [Devosiaceae bacterium]|nr:c-type cytochrome biogenesis protein CcmI [Devosiaceae bacterium]
MLFWLLAIAIAVIVCAALYYAAVGRTVNVSMPDDSDPTTDHFRLQLQEIESDIAAGRLPGPEGLAAKAELARELLRVQRDNKAKAEARKFAGTVILPVSIAAVALIAFVTYAFLGNPGLPSQPFATRPDEAAQNIKLDDAVKAVEARLAQHPDDLRGWQVIAPIYMQTGKYALAEHAFRQILALSPATADADTDLAEALMMQNGGQATGEAGTLLKKAETLDPRHVRSRFYLAAQSMRDGDYTGAVTQWNDIIALGKGDEPWMATAKAGLAAAEAGRDGKPLPGTLSGPAAGATPGSTPAQPVAILGMVNNLSARLAKNGGSLDDWTRLVRSEIVLGDLAKAQSAYNAARKAYPDAGERADLDGLAAQAGLKIDGSSP